MRNTELSRRGFLSAAGLGIMGLALTGCSGEAEKDAGSAGSASSASTSQTVEKPEAVEVRVASLKGPTTIGLVDFMDKAADEKTAGDYAGLYSFQLSTAADEILPLLIKGEVDIALIPANAASVVYNKTEGAITCLDVNTLGVLSVVTGDSSVKEFADLKDRTVYLTGKGTTPEYTMDYLLDAVGIADSVTLEFKSEAAEVVSVLASDPSAVGVLPQPFVTAALAKNDKLSAPVDLTDVWDEVSQSEGTDSRLVTGVTVVRNAFLEENPAVVQEFLMGQRASVKAVNEDPAAAAKLVVAQGILDSEAVAAKAIPACHLVCLTDRDLKEALPGYLTVLHDADAASVGGKLPGDDFYYEVEGA